MQTVAFRNRHLGSKNCTDRLEVRQLDYSANTWHGEAVSRHGIECRIFNDFDGSSMLVSNNSSKR